MRESKTVLVVKGGGGKVNGRWVVVIRRDLYGLVQSDCDGLGGLWRGLLCWVVNEILGAKDRRGEKVRGKGKDRPIAVGGAVFGGLPPAFT